MQHTELRCAACFSRSLCMHSWSDVRRVMLTALALRIFEIYWIRTLHCDDWVLSPYILPSKYALRSSFSLPRPHHSDYSESTFLFLTQGMTQLISRRGSGLAEVAKLGRVEYGRLR